MEVLQGGWKKRWGCSLGWAGMTSGEVKEGSLGTHPAQPQWRFHQSLKIQYPGTGMTAYTGCTVLNACLNATMYTRKIKGFKRLIPYS
jgi:hypothetical protein